VIKATERGWVFNRGDTVDDLVQQWAYDGITVCPQCSGHPSFYEHGDPCSMCGYPGGEAVPLPMTTAEAIALVDEREIIWKSLGYQWEQEMKRLREADEEIDRAAYLRWRGDLR
jgi:hypothetical protein